MFKASAPSATAGARAGVWTLGGADIATPALLVATTRGCVPHLTPDNQPARAAAPAFAVFAEELYDSRGAVPALFAEGRLPLRAGTPLLAALRRPGAPAGRPNTDAAVAIGSLQGSRTYAVAELAAQVARLAPAAVVLPHDAPAQSPGGRAGSNRVRKMRTRTLAWAAEFARATAAAAPAAPSGAAAGAAAQLLASLPEDLRDADFVAELAAAAPLAGVYLDGPGLFDAAGLAPLPGVRVCGSVRSPAQILEAVLAGVDVFYAPVEEFTGRGQALAFTLDAAAPAFALDLTDPVYKTDMAHVGATGHARAYLHHLLDAQEMTAQVLLQQHNLAVLARFFADIRAAVAAGTLEDQARRFWQAYGGPN